MTTTKFSPGDLVFPISNPSQVYVVLSISSTAHVYGSIFGENCNPVVRDYSPKGLQLFKSNPQTVTPQEAHLLQPGDIISRGEFIYIVTEICAGNPLKIFVRWYKDFIGYSLPFGHFEQGDTRFIARPGLPLITNLKDLKNILYAPPPSKAVCSCSVLYKIDDSSVHCFSMDAAMKFAQEKANLTQKPVTLAKQWGRTSTKTITLQPQFKSGQLWLSRDGLPVYIIVRPKHIVTSRSTEDGHGYLRPDGKVSSHIPHTFDLVKLLKDVA